jgi:hypothetical protein
MVILMLLSPCLASSSVHALATAANKAAAILAVIRAGQAAGGAGSGITANLMMPYTITCAVPRAGPGVQRRR